MTSRHRSGVGIRDSNVVLGGGGVARKAPSRPRPTSALCSCWPACPVSATELTTIWWKPRRTFFLVSLGCRRIRAATPVQEEFSCAPASADESETKEVGLPFARPSASALIRRVGGRTRQSAELLQRIHHIPETPGISLVLDDIRAVARSSPADAVESEQASTPTSALLRRYQDLPEEFPIFSWSRSLERAFRSSMFKPSTSAENAIAA